MHLPRLARERYRGFAFIHWSMSMDDRATGWLTADFHNVFRTHLRHTSACHQLICPMYCLMPDHIHLLWVGLRLVSDQTLAVRRLRRGLNEEFNSLQFQKQAFDHVLREEERERGAFQSVAFYILANPLRAGLVERMEDYPYSGAMIEGFPTANIQLRTRTPPSGEGGYGSRATRVKISGTPSSTSSSAQRISLRCSSG